MIKLIPIRKHKSNYYVIFCCLGLNKVPYSFNSTIKELLIKNYNAFIQNKILYFKNIKDINDAIEFIESYQILKKLKR
ncbi:MAG: hypothetical protein ACOCP8_10325 [archaeon]